LPSIQQDKRIAGPQLEKKMMCHIRCRISAFVLIGVVFLPLTCADSRADETGPLAASVQLYVTRQELAGAVMLAATKDKVLSVEAVGFADVAGKKPMQPDSIFWIASQSDLESDLEDPT
jgi:hypothetical protein